MKVGDRVRIFSKGMDPNDSYTERHRAHEGKEGEITRVDPLDATVIVRIGEGAAWWFRTEWLTLVEPPQKPDIQYCSCGGPEKTVIILFQPVRVCETCKKEKP